MNIKELRRHTGLSQSKFGELYNIPLRTIQDWENEKRNPPSYVVSLLERAILEDFPKSKKESE